MLDFIFHRDETNLEIVKAKYIALLELISATKAISFADHMELRRLAIKLAVMRVKEKEIARKK